jgi:hypothetical protein
MGLDIAVDMASDMGLAIAEAPDMGLDTQVELDTVVDTPPVVMPQGME